MLRLQSQAKLNILHVLDKRIIYTLRGRTLFRRSISSNLLLQLFADEYRYSNLRYPRYFISPWPEGVIMPAELRDH